MKKSMLFIVFFILTVFLFGCQHEELLLLEGIEIEAVDQVNVPAGTYQIPYTIEELTSLINTYAAVLAFTVFNQNQQAVLVTGESITIEPNMIYTVNIKLKVKDEFIEKTITITAVTQTQLFSTVIFNVNGGAGSFPNQTVVMGGYATVPASNPTKEGFNFGGWYANEMCTNLFNFQMVIDANMTIYAKWIENIQPVFYTVTYDFNGAPQLEAVTEKVQENNKILGLIINPIFTNHTFLGWALDSEGLEPWNLDEDVVTSNLKLFANWKYTYTEIEAYSYFSEPTFLDESTMIDFDIEQNIQSRLVLDMKEYLKNHPSEEKIEAIGMLFSLSEPNPRYYSINTNKEEQLDSLDRMEGQYLIDYRLTAYNLVEDSTYYATYYLRFESTICYSDTKTFKTAHKVPTGTVVGASNILSGGYYQMDNGTESTRPNMIFEIKQGYEATHNNSSYSSYQRVYQAGFNSLITTDVETNERYLHVYHVTYQKPFVDTQFTIIDREEIGLVLQYQFDFNHIEYIEYPISEVGILFSNDNPFLLIGLPGASKHVGTINSNHTGFENTHGYQYPLNHETIYARGYVIINGKIHYSKLINSFIYYAQAGYYITSSTLNVSNMESTTGSGYDIYVGNGVELDAFKVTGLTYTKTTYVSSAHLSEAGIYLIYKQGLNFVYEVFILDAVPEVSGVIDGATYSKSVIIEIDMYTPYWYYSIDEGDYFYLPSSIKLITPGLYNLYYRGVNGMESLSFTITE